MMFYEAVIVVDGYAETTGRPTPTSHKARRRLVGKYFPHLVYSYRLLHGASVSARYYDGYVLTEHMRRQALRCYETIMSSMPK